MKQFSLSFNEEELEILLDACDPAIQCESDAIVCYPDDAETFERSLNFWKKLKTNLEFLIEQNNR